MPTPLPVIPRQYELQVTDIAPISPKVIWVQLKPITTLTYIAGQYGSLLIGNHRRPLSFAIPARGETTELVVDISPDGVASQYIAQLKINDVVTMLAPYGRFVVHQPVTRSLLFIATGSGIAPIRAQILAELTSTNHPHSLTLIFGNRSEEHLLFHEEFSHLAAKYTQFRYVPVLSEASGSWPGQRGLVTEVTPEHFSPLTNYNTYICGSPQMVQDMRAILTAQGVPPLQVHFEEFKLTG